VGGAHQRGGAGAPHGRVTGGGVERAGGGQGSGAR
jgi:hypothetical protein